MRASAPTSIPTSRASAASIMRSSTSRGRGHSGSTPPISFRRWASCRWQIRDAWRWWRRAGRRRCCSTPRGAVFGQPVARGPHDQRRRGRQGAGGRDLRAARGQPGTPCARTTARAERKQIEERLGSYVRSTYKAKTLARWADLGLLRRRPAAADRARDRRRGHRIDHRRDGDGVAAALRAVRAVARVPAQRRRRRAQAPRGFRRPHASTTSTSDPHVHELRYRIAGAARLRARSAPRRRDDLTLGPARYSAAYRPGARRHASARRFASIRASRASRPPS